MQPRVPGTVRELGSILFAGCRRDRDHPGCPHRDHMARHVTRSDEARLDSMWFPAGANLNLKPTTSQARPPSGAKEAPCGPMRCAFASAVCP
jgi:hypothetical protein